MITIVMPYRDRQEQLTRTLLSIKSDEKFNIIIVDDNSPEQIRLPKLDYQCKVIRLNNKTWNNPEPAYNTGLIEAIKYNPEIIIIQNPECLHSGDIIKHAKDNCNNTNYLTYGCFSLSKESTEKQLYQTNNNGASRDGQDAWYNHTLYRPVAYEFCAAITAENMRKLNGYDERLMYGWGSGDRYFLFRTKLLSLKVEIIDSPFVFHQFHYSVPAFYNNAANIQINNQEYNKLIAERNYKAVHLITSDL